MTMQDPDALVAAIETMDLDMLRASWRQRYGPPPALRSASIMRMLLAWRVQAEAYGGLDKVTVKALARTGSIEPEGRQLGVGTTLSRNWKGKMVTVTIEPDGFRWEGTLFASLSAAATAIAGSRWNGPRFFGLREDK